MNTDPMELDMIHRADDPPIKITREIPLWGVLGVVATIIGQAAVVWFTQREQGDKLTQVIVELKSVTSAIGAANVKDVQHDLLIADLQRRVQAIEAREGK